MPETLVVFDTHIILGAITKSSQNHKKAYDKMIERPDYKLLISKRLLNNTKA
jgi:hypothetical protein